MVSYFFFFQFFIYLFLFSRTNCFLLRSFFTFTLDNIEFIMKKKNERKNETHEYWTVKIKIKTFIEYILLLYFCFFFYFRELHCELVLRRQHNTAEKTCDRGRKQSTSYYISQIIKYYLWIFKRGWI